MKASIDQLCDRFGGSLLETPEGLLVLEPSARRACRVPNDLLHGPGAADSVALVTKFFESCRDEPAPDPVSGLEIHYVGPLPFSPSVHDAIDRLVQAGEEKTYAAIVMHVTEFRGPLWDALAEYEPNGRLYGNIIIRGRLPEDINPEEGSLITRCGIKLYEVAGWWPGCDPESADRVDRSRIERISRLGVRVPVLWYAHRDNLDSILDHVEDALRANYHAGLAIEPVSASGHYRGQDSDPDPPDADGYCELLVEAYRRYRHYDDVFQPLTMLAFNVSEGAWSRELGVPVPLKVLVRDDGPCGLFRHVPAMAAPWLPPDEVARLAPQDLLDRLLAAARPQFDLASNEFCKDCRWRSLCGGMDRFLATDAAGARNAELFCSYRTLFIESFVRQAYPFDETQNRPA